MAKFMLLLPEEPGKYAGQSQDDYMAIVKDYMAWAEKMGATGRLVGGQKLAEEAGRVLKRTDKGTDVHEGPYAEVREVLGGFYIVEAEDYDDAADFVKDCPHLKYFGSLEIRRIEEF